MHIERVNAIQRRAFYSVVVVARARLAAYHCNALRPQHAHVCYVMCVCQYVLCEARVQSISLHAHTSQRHPNEMCGIWRAIASGTVCFAHSYFARNANISACTRRFVVSSLARLEQICGFFGSHFWCARVARRLHVHVFTRLYLKQQASNMLSISFLDFARSIEPLVTRWHATPRRDGMVFFHRIPKRT